MDKNPWDVTEAGAPDPEDVAQARRDRANLLSRERRAKEKALFEAGAPEAMERKIKKAASRKVTDTRYLDGRKAAAAPGVGVPDHADNAIERKLREAEAEAKKITKAANRVLPDRHYRERQKALKTAQATSGAAAPLSRFSVAAAHEPLGGALGKQDASTQEELLEMGSGVPPKYSVHAPPTIFHRALSPELPHTGLHTQKHTVPEKRALLEKTLREFEQAFDRRCATSRDQSSFDVRASGAGGAAGGSGRRVLEGGAGGAAGGSGRRVLEGGAGGAAGGSGRRVLEGGAGGAAGGSGRRVIAGGTGVEREFRHADLQSIIDQEGPLKIIMQHFTREHAKHLLALVSRQLAASVRDENVLWKAWTEFEFDSDVYPDVETVHELFEQAYPFYRRDKLDPFAEWLLEELFREDYSVEEKWEVIFECIPNEGHLPIKPDEGRTPREVSDAYKRWLANVPRNWDVWDMKTLSDKIKGLCLEKVSPSCWQSWEAPPKWCECVQLAFAEWKMQLPFVDLNRIHRESILARLDEESFRQVQKKIDNKIKNKILTNWNLFGFALLKECHNHYKLYEGEEWHDNFADVREDFERDSGSDYDDPDYDDE